MLRLALYFRADCRAVSDRIALLRRLAMSAPLHLQSAMRQTRIFGLFVN